MYDKQEPKSIQTLFNAIAPAYDRTNKILSLGMHRHWNQKLIKHVGHGEVLLDLCAGTGDIAFSFMKKYSARAYLLDFSKEMLCVAKVKAKRLGLINNDLRFIQGDAQKIPLDDASVDAATIAYGIRNITNPLDCIKEVSRVLKPGGTFGILELTRPTHPLLRAGHGVYLQKVLPLVGKLITSNKEAYKYLSSSIQGFLAPELLVSMLNQSGFENVKTRALFGGVATIITGTKL